jgi:hypothetical protein
MKVIAWSPNLTPEKAQEAGAVFVHMKAEFSVLTPAANGLRTCTGAPATPINAPRFFTSAS